MFFPIPQIYIQALMQPSRYTRTRSPWQDGLAQPVPGYVGARGQWVGVGWPEERGQGDGVGAPVRPGGKLWVSGGFGCQGGSGWGAVGVHVGVHGGR